MKEQFQFTYYKHNNQISQRTRKQDENIFLTRFAEISNPSRCTIVASSIRNVTSWFRTIIGTGFVTVTTINIKTDTSYPQ